MEGCSEKQYLFPMLQFADMRPVLVLGRCPACKALSHEDDWQQHIEWHAKRGDL